MIPGESVFVIPDCLEALTVALIDGCNVSLEELSSTAGIVWDDAIASATLDDGETVVALGHLRLPTSIAHLGSRIKRWKRTVAYDLILGQKIILQYFVGMYFISWLF